MDPEKLEDMKGKLTGVMDEFAKKMKEEDRDKIADGDITDFISSIMEISGATQEERSTFRDKQMPTIMDVFYKIVSQSESEGLGDIFEDGRGTIPDLPGKPKYDK